MAVPSDPSRVGWFNRSARIEDVIGATVIAGHVSDRQDRPGALFRLKSIQRGDIITITKGGQTFRFEVTGLRSYSRNQQLPSNLFTTAGPHVLHLITCTGRASTASGRFHYTKNLVVTARAVP